MSRSHVPDHGFELSRIEERWVVDRGLPRLVEMRSEAGASLIEGSRSGLLTIEARSTTCFPQPSSFGGASERALSLLIELLPRDRTMHLRRVTERRLVQDAGGEEFTREQTYVSIRAAGAGSLVVSLEEDSLARLREVLPLLDDAGPGQAAPRALPIAWLGGTAAVLFHEAAGHPAEAGAPPLHWPRWLELIDDPEHRGLGRMERDDAGLRPAAALLHAGESPAALRRAGFRDVPLRRMTNLVVRAAGAPTGLPDPRIEVLLLAGGSWDASTDVVEIRVARARRIEGETAAPLAPFTWRAERAALARAIVGAQGAALAYPGVICGDEGQRVPVGSFAPAIVTEPVG